MAQGQIQARLFQQIREKLPPNASLADTVAELLFVSTDSAYRRIRGETPLVLEETKTLCDTFGISMDELLGSTPSTVSFTVSEVNNGPNSFEDYLKGILANFRLISTAADKEIFYLSKDVPVFHNFLFRPLFSFRYFFWMKSIIQHPDFTRQQFSIDMLPREVEDLGREIIEYYTSIPSTEIWNTEAVNSLVSQVEYYREAGYFRSESEVVNVYKGMEDLLGHICTEADLGRKFMPGESPSSRKDNFQFFFNRVVLGDNTILVEMDGRKIVFLPFDVLNYMVTQDEKFCDAVYDKLQTLMRRGTILSNTSDKQRNMFFNILLRKIQSRNFITTNG